jgi:hypothetical protein
MRTKSRELLAVGIFGSKSRVGDRIETLLRRGLHFFSANIENRRRPDRRYSRWSRDRRLNRSPHLEASRDEGRRLRFPRMAR